MGRPGPGVARWGGAAAARRGPWGGWGEGGAHNFWVGPAHAQGLAYESPQGDWFHAKSFWCLIGVAVRDGEPILCEVRATPLGVLFRVVCSFCV